MKDRLWSVRDQEGFAPTYTEEYLVMVRMGNLRALLDAVRGSLDFGSGFLDEETVEAMQEVAVHLGVDPKEVTPEAFYCKYWGHLVPDRPRSQRDLLYPRCVKCNKTQRDDGTWGFV